jgi:hypothetical protein
MPNIDAIVRQINKDLVPQFEERLRQHLAAQDKDWLIEQIVRLTLDAHSLEEMDRKFHQEVTLKRRVERLERLRSIGLNREALIAFLQDYGTYDRARLIEDGYLSAEAPPKGTDLIADKFRTPPGNALLDHAKDMLFGLLFGDESTYTHLVRIQRELLTLTLPAFKADALAFMKATTEFGALGTWQDPDHVSNDLRAHNVILEVEYGEVEGELVGLGIARALSLINNLEVNEQILYARMIDVEQTTLIE